FTDARLQSLATCLGHTRINELVGRISTIIASRVRRADPVYSAVRRRAQSPNLQLPDKALATSYIKRILSIFLPVLALDVTEIGSHLHIGSLFRQCSSALPIPRS